MPKIEKFSFDTIVDFDKHIDSSIQNYSGLIEHINNISTYFIQKNSTILDIGCSTGSLLIQNRIKHTDQSIKFLGFDISENLLVQGREIIKQADLQNISLENIDIVQYSNNETSINDFNSFVDDEINLVTSIFTLQFLPIESRQKIVDRIYNSLNKGGAFIVAEKIYNENGLTQDILNFAHYDFKRKTFSSEEILSKQIDLRTIMKPLTDKQNIEMFEYAGFENISTFWQSLSFKCYLLIK